MTDESKAQTEPWVQSHRAAYPYAYDPGGRLNDWFDIQSIPHAVLLDPDGVVVWKGHPARLDEATIRNALRFAIAAPITGWPRETMKLQLLLKQGRYGPAMTAAMSLGEPYKSFVADRIAGKIGAVERAHAAGDYLVASRLGATVVNELVGLREALTVKKLVDSMRRDREVQRVIRGQMDVMAFAGELANERDARRRKDIERKVEDLVRGFTGTIVERQARGLLASVTTSTPR